MDMIKDVEFLQFFAAKLFHDLAGSLGAIGSAIEFVNSNDPEIRSQALELMELSSTQTADRLKFLRYAYGVSKYNGDADLATIRDLCLLLEKDNKIKVEFLSPGSLTNEKSMSVTAGQLILCLAALAKSSLLRGGTVKVSWENKNSIIVSATGDNIKNQVEAHDIINGNADVSINPTNVHAYYIKRLIDSRNIKIIIKLDKDKVSYIIDSKTA
jgi:histidine phosphotransferase ChpT